MLKNIKDIDINYIRYGNQGGNTIVLLHGWGQNIEMMQPIGDNLKNDFDIIIMDLPGHGKSEEPKSVWTIYDFAAVVHELLEELNVSEPIMIGHSFGGKISLAYASKYKTKKMVLFGSPYCREITKVSLKTKMLKKVSKMPGLSKVSEFAKKHMGSTDYRNASKMMRDILVAHVNLDITEDIKKIKCSTLLIWGTNDTAVPLKRAYEIESLIPDAAVIEYQGCTHYAYLENLGQTINILNNFLK